MRERLLEEIRLLTNDEDRANRQGHVVLLGEPEPRRRVAARPRTVAEDRA